MARKHFTDRWARTAKTDKQQTEVYDSGFKVRGVSFGLKLSRSGGRDYFVRFRNRAGKKRYLTLGSAHEMTLSEAHGEAAQRKAEIDDGKDPAAEKRALLSAPTVRELAMLYYEREAVKQQRPKTYLERRRIIDSDIIPTLGELKAAEVTRRDIIALLENIAHDRGAEIMASRVRTVLFSIFRYGVDRELVPHNPCIHLPRMVQTRARDRALSEEEIRTLWLAFDTIPFGLGSLYRLLMLLGQRMNETAGLKWSEIEGETWHLPGERAKNGKAHLVPLPPMVMRLLAEVKEHNEKAKQRSRINDSEKDFFDEFAFPESHNRAAVKYPGQRFRKLVASLKMPHVTLHDLRRTAASHLRRLGVAADTVEKILNHAPRSVLGRHYDRYTAEKEKRQALNRWCRELERIVKSEPKEKVVPLRRVN